jgi:hypothetical protein
VLQALGFTRPAPPAASTLHGVFRSLDVAAFEAAPARWAQPPVGARPVRAVDGRGLRDIQGAELPGGRLVAAYCDEAGRVLAQAGGADRGA